jgi:flagella synthesis protein FlgN
MSKQIGNNEFSPNILLNQQHQQLTELVELIASEKLILQEHDPEALLLISEEKNTLLLAIEALDRKLSQDKGFAQDKATGILTNALANISSLLDQCKQQNINGQIIQQSKLAVERMKTSLLENHNKNAITYDSKGKKSAGLSSLGLKA